MDDIHKYVFNDIIWPDFTILSAGDFPILEFTSVNEGEEIKLNGHSITAYRVDHNVNAVGFVIRDDHGSILYSGDTGPTEEIWKKGGELPDLRAIVTEVSFPNRLQSVANSARHFTPKSLGEELSKMPPDVPIYLFHEKTRFHEEVQKDLEALKEPRLQMLVQGKIYEF